MNIKMLAGSAVAVALMGLGLLTGSVVGSPDAAAQTPAATSTSSAAQTAPAAAATPGTSAAVVITQQQAEQAALAAAPGSTVDHTQLVDNNGAPFWDVDFTNGGGARVDANTGKVIATEAAGTDQGGPGGHGGPGGADQAALAAKATVTQQQAEQTALAAAPGSTVDHSRLGQDSNGTVYWDVDFTNGGGVEVDANTNKVITVEAAGTDHPNGGRPGGHGGKGGSGAPGTTPQVTPTPQS
ncbi:MAG: PepSY domain-containing protein [Chloroflexia bacterium]